MPSGFSSQFYFRFKVSLDKKNSKDVFWQIIAIYFFYKLLIKSNNINWKWSRTDPRFFGITENLTNRIVDIHYKITWTYLYKW